MGSARVTVIIAAHNAAETLPETLASLRAQTYDSWDAIVVDDGSSDRTAEIARAAGPGVAVVRHDRAHGPAAARNRAAREARGELLATLDADDVWKPGYLSGQLSAYDAAGAAGRRVGAVCCDADLIGPSGPTGMRWSDRVGGITHVDLTVLLRENVVFTSVLMPRTVFGELGGYDEDPALGVEDYDLWLRMVERGWEIVFNPEVLALYRLGGQTQSAKVERMARGSQLTMERALARGGLTRAQRRLARRRRRVFGVVATRARIEREPRLVRKGWIAARAAPLVALSIAEHPARWAKWLRRGPRPVGRERHSGLHA